MDGTNRIKFYSKHDFAAVYHLERIPGVLDKESSQLDFNDINQIIELENIRKYIDSGLFLAQSLFLCDKTFLIYS